MFAHREVRVGVGVAVTDRYGGTSRAPYAELNLADHVGDDLDAVLDNRRLVAAALGVDTLVVMRQVHGSDIAVIDEPPTELPVADVLVTRTPGLALTVLVADCSPVLLWDRRARVVAAAHVGRRGLVAGTVVSAIEAMTSLGARADRIAVHVGAGICPEHYEVPAEMRDEVASVVRDTAATTSSGLPALNITHGVAAQLTDAGIRRMSVTMQCTAEYEEYYSYRRDGTTGRFAGLVWLE